MISFYISMLRAWLAGFICFFLGITFFVINVNKFFLSLIDTRMQIHVSL